TCTQRLREIEVTFRGARIGSKRAAKQLDRLRLTSASQRHDAEQVQAVEMPGIEAQHVMAEALGFLRLPGAKWPEGRAEHLGAGRGAECARCGRTGAAPLLLALFLGRASFLAIHD